MWRLLSSISRHSKMRASPPSFTSLQKAAMASAFALRTCQSHTGRYRQRCGCTQSTCSDQSINKSPSVSLKLHHARAQCKQNVAVSRLMAVYMVVTLRAETFMLAGCCGATLSRYLPRLCWAACLHTRSKVGRLDTWHRSLELVREYPAVGRGLALFLLLLRRR